jgi:hypothetical protein
MGEEATPGFLKTAEQIFARNKANNLVKKEEEENQPSDEQAAVNILRSKAAEENGKEAVSTEDELSMEQHLEEATKIMTEAVSGTSREVDEAALQIKHIQVLRDLKLELKDKEEEFEKSKLRDDGTEVPDNVYHPKRDEKKREMEAVKAEVEAKIKEMALILKVLADSREANRGDKLLFSHKANARKLLAGGSAFSDEMRAIATRLVETRLGDSMYGEESDESSEFNISDGDVTAESRLDDRKTEVKPEADKKEEEKPALREVKGEINQGSPAEADAEPSPDDSPQGVEKESLKDDLKKIEDLEDEVDDLISEFDESKVKEIIDKLNTNILSKAFKLVSSIRKKLMDNADGKGMSEGEVGGMLEQYLKTLNEKIKKLEELIKKAEGSDEETQDNDDDESAEVEENETVQETDQSEQEQEKPSRWNKFKSVTKALLLGGEEAIFYIPNSTPLLGSAGRAMLKQTNKLRPEDKQKAEYRYLYKDVASGIKKVKDIGKELRPEREEVGDQPEAPINVPEAVQNEPDAVVQPESEFVTEPQPTETEGESTELDSVRDALGLGEIFEKNEGEPLTIEEQKRLISTLLFAKSLYAPGSTLDRNIPDDWYDVVRSLNNDIITRDDGTDRVPDNPSQYNQDFRKILESKNIEEQQFINYFESDHNGVNVFDKIKTLLGYDQISAL